MEEEARRILVAALADHAAPAPDLPESFGGAIRQIFEPLGGWELELPPREPTREPPDFRKRPVDKAGRAPGPARRPADKRNP